MGPSHPVSPPPRAFKEQRSPELQGIRRSAVFVLYPVPWDTLGCTNGFDSFRCLPIATSKARGIGAFENGAIPRRLDGQQKPQKGVNMSGRRYVGWEARLGGRRLLLHGAEKDGGRCRRAKSRRERSKEDPGKTSLSARVPAV